MADVVSSRTPEGWPNRCPLCEAEIRIEPSLPFGDAPCPRCGVLLWFVRFDSETRYYEEEHAEAIRERLRQLIWRNFGVVPDEQDSEAMLDLVNELRMDSIDFVEMAVECEEEFEGADE
ncbi:MAG: hypothetical protein WD069_04570 [Planctomycetales bacterium]